ncbi:protein RIC-3 isoform X2 [Varanus komodoensis]|uniref:protein RIC-3 isoform X2 n=1 Tax=Varanus komodoensis TaxID=61221 RepID=UPI001CF7B99E|nr:protein RIC-3 isoform X2 [Varanus komodoensis]
MAYSTFRRVALASCVVLCVSLLLPKVFLPRGWRQQEPSGGAPPTPAGGPEGKAGWFPPTMRPQVFPEVKLPATHFPRSHLAEAVAKAKGGGGGGGAGGGGGSGSGRGLVGQVIPIYGFGILLYILYILFKLSSKGKTMAAERTCPSVSGNTNRKITDYELAQLQDKLKETEEAMEKLISRVGPNCERAQNSTTNQEKRLLQQLREITKVMKEGKLIDGISPEKEAEEAPYMQDWEGYPEETYPDYDHSDCFKRRQDTILVDYPDPSQPSAEEIAERMEFVDDEDCLCSETLLSALAIVNDGLAAGQEKDQCVPFSNQCETDHHLEKCYCCYYEDDDPAVIAENAGFCSDSCSETEEAAAGEQLVDSDLANAEPREQNDGNPDGIGILRKRNTKGLELLEH